MIFKRLLFLSTIALGVSFTSCKKDEEEVVINPPKIQVISNNAQDVTTGKFIQIVAVVNAEADLSQINVTRSTTAGSGTINPFPRNQGFKTKTSDTVRVDYVISEPSNTDLRITISAKDKDGRETSEVILVKIGAPLAPFPNVTVMGAQSATAGSFLRTNDALVMTIAQARQTSEDVDMCYLWGDNNLDATFAAPSSNLTDVFPAASRPSTWSTRNATTFKMTNLTAAEFDDLESDVLVKELAENLTDVSISNLVADKVFVFKTSALRGSKVGLIKIRQIRSTGAAGEILVSMKIQP